MTAPEHQINQGDVGSPIVDTVTFSPAINLTAAAFQFVFKTLESDEETVRDATLVSASVSSAAAISAVFRCDLDLDDVTTPGYFIYEWRIIRADETVLIRPTSAPTDQFPDRSRPTFQIVESLSPSGDDLNESTIMANRPLVVANLTEMALLSWSTNYRLVLVENDANGNPGLYWWDISITPTSALAEDPTGSLVVALTDTHGGGFRRKGL